jgi:hypothetical protein
MREIAFYAARIIVRDKKVLFIMQQQQLGYRAGKRLFFKRAKPIILASIQMAHIADVRS